MYITKHAIMRYQSRVADISEAQLLSLAKASIKYGKRHNNAYVYQGVVFGFNAAFDTLKTVYVVSC